MKTFESMSAVKLRAVVAALLLAIGFLLYHAAVVIHPLGTTNSLGGQVSVAASHPSEILLFSVLYLISSISLVPGLVLLAGLVHARGAWFTFAAISVVLIGSVGNVGESAFRIAFVAIAPNPGHGQFVAAMSDLNAYVGPFLALAAVFDLGLLLLCAAMWRARLVPAWPLVVTFAGDVIGAFAFGGKPGIDAGLVVATIGLLWMCTGIARRPRAEITYRPSVTSLDPQAGTTV